MVHNFCNQTIHNCYYIIRMSKCCGYSAIVIVPKYATIYDLANIIELQFGPGTFAKTYFTHDNMKVYMGTLPIYELIKDLTRRLTMSYTLDECAFSVYQMYYESHCCATDL